eukprot:7010696-Pyramimonas_sp.AAC.1
MGAGALCLRNVRVMMYLAGGCAPRRRPTSSPYKRSYNDTMHITIMCRLSAWYPANFGRQHARRPRDEALAEAEDVQDRLQRRAAAWAARWLPDIFLHQRGIDNQADWQSWRENYVASVLLRDELRPLYQTDTQRLSSARAMCRQALEDGAFGRRLLELRLLGNPGPRAEDLREASRHEAELAAEHRARRRWVEALRDAHPDPAPPGEPDPPDDMETDDPDDLICANALPSDMKERWLRLRTHLAELPPARLWAVMKTLSGGWTTSYRMH